jgi:methyl-accepting chemotaxis protein
MDWTFGRRLALGFGIAVLTVLLVGAAGHRVTTELIETDRSVAHTHQVKRTLVATLASMREAESHQRGYVLTGDESLVEPYRLAVSDALKHFSETRDLTRDNPEQQRRLAELLPRMQSRLAIMARVVELRRTQGLDAVLKSGLLLEGKEEMTEVRKSVDEAEATERRLLEERERRSEQNAALAKLTITWGSALGLGLIAIAGLLISRSLSLQVGVAVRHIQTSAAELQAAANQQAGGAKEQTTAMNEITTTISELLATSRQIAESARSVAEIATQTAGQARAGDGTVARGAEAAAAIKKQVDAIVSHMLELGRKSQQIGSVLDIVTELAEQTNILAINATIEAAGAGESGKRFGVVADEIRKLADRVGGSTKEIRGLIDDVRAAVNTTIMTTETGSKAVEAGSAQFSEVAISFRDISSSVLTATQAAREIELSTKQQASAVEQVNIAITNVAQASKEGEVSTGQTLRTAAELASLSRDLLRLVEAREPAAPPRLAAG